MGGWGRRAEAWKRLVLVLHPDKLQRLGEGVREDGAEALHRVHRAKEELRKRAQDCADPPGAVVSLSAICAISSSRNDGSAASRKACQLEKHLHAHTTSMRL